MMITFPPRRMTLHFSHIFRTLGRTFIVGISSTASRPRFRGAFEPKPGSGTKRAVYHRYSGSPTWPSRREPSLRVGQDPRSVGRHGNGVFEVGGQAPVLRDHGPAIVQEAGFEPPGVHHRLD